MIGGLPWPAWLLLIAAVGPGLFLVTTHYIKRRSSSRDE
jgi:hypothetical protein